MIASRDVQYLVDEKGRRKSIVMSYKAYLRLLEDLADLQVKAERGQETPEDFKAVLAELKNAGRI